MLRLDKVIQWDKKSSYIRQNSEGLSASMVRSQNLQLTAITEDLVQTLAGLMLAASVSVSLYDFCLVDAVGYILLVSSTHF